ncbi:MAG: hypothetical protein ACI9WU_004059, partial [Myxococcota bacterium]
MTFAEDADGRRLPAHLELGDPAGEVQELRIVVDDAAARYPIVVDPTVGPCPASWCSDGDASTVDVCTVVANQTVCEHVFDPGFEDDVCTWGIFCCSDSRFHSSCDGVSGGGGCDDDWCDDGDFTTLDHCVDHNTETGVFACLHPIDPLSEGKPCVWGAFCCSDGFARP